MILFVNNTSNQFIMCYLHLSKLVYRFERLSLICFNPYFSILKILELDMDSDIYSLQVMTIV